MGTRIKQLSFQYLITYLGVGAIGFAFLPDLVMTLFLSNGEYGDVMPRLVGVMMGLLSFILLMIYRRGHWKEFSPLTIIARTPLVAFLVYLYIHSEDPMFLVITGIVSVGLIATIIGTLIERGEQVV